MPSFKYTVTNAEGKKLSGTVQAPEENTARGELNNLGFSILELEQIAEPSPETSTTAQQTEQTPSSAYIKKFVFEAVDKNAKLIIGTIPSPDEEEAFKKLQTEYNLTVTAIWAEGSADNIIAEAKKRGTQALREKLQLTAQSEQQIAGKSLQEEKEEQLVKAKIENILKEVGILLQEFDKDFEPGQKAEIKKRIDKLLRIKHSTNINYILDTANDLLTFIQEQEKYLKEKGYQEKQLQLELKTRKLLEELNQGERKKTLSEDIVGKIQNWQRAHIKTYQETPASTKLINSFLNRIKRFFETPSEIIALKAQIKAYNKQLITFAKLYFKEPTSEYKEKVKQSLKTVWQARKKAKENLKAVKKGLKEQRKREQGDERLMSAFVEELNSFTGWLLAFYIIYYFVSLYINNKNFGFAKIPEGFVVYQSQIFKYALVTLFLLHSATALKLNFFRNSIIASIILPPSFALLTIIALLNF